MQETATSSLETQTQVVFTTIQPIQAATSNRRVLDPMDRISEVLFGLIMVLTVTCSLSVATTGPGAIHEILIAALGCNLAWGIIDAIMFLMARISERGQGILALRAVRRAAHPEDAYGAIAGVLPPVLVRILSPAEFEAMRQRLTRLPEPPDHPHLGKSDWVGAVGVFLLVFLSTLPVLVPFVVMGPGRLTMRVSNGVAILMLFVCGYAFGRHVGYRPARMGVSMVVVGMALVGIAILLGG